MNLLRIITTIDPALGGVSQAIRNSAPELEKLGVKNEVVSLDDPSASFLGKDPFTIHALGPATGPWSYSPKLIPWLLENFHRFDAILVEGLWGYISYATAKALRQFKSKTNGKTPALFVMPHGMLDPYFQRAPERRLKAIRNWFYWKIIENRVISDASGVLFTCEAELQLAREPFRPYQPKREINVGFGVQQPPAFNTGMRDAFFEKCPAVKGRRYILFLGRIHEKKGVDLLVRSFAELKSSSTNGIADLHVVIAGPGLESAYGQTVLAEIKDDIRDFIHFPGMLSGASKWGAFYGSSAFILPSHQENFGIAVAEALACGKPVLISNQVNIWREIQTGGGGLVAADTLEGTKQLLLNWVNLSEEEKTKMEHLATQTFESNFSVQPAAVKLRKALSDS